MWFLALLSPQSPPKLSVADKHGLRQSQDVRWCTAPAQQATRSRAPPPPPQRCCHLRQNVRQRQEACQVAREKWCGLDNDLLCADSHAPSLPAVGRQHHNIDCEGSNDRVALRMRCV